MPFDPTKPASGTRASSAEMRAQFTALKALIDAVPAGPAGPEGPVGPAFSSVQIGGVTTGTPGSPAGAQVNVFGNNVEVSFTIPAGETGAQGEVSNATLMGEISSTARNPASVAPLSIGTTDPTITAIVDKLNELISALAR